MKTERMLPPGEITLTTRQAARRLGLSVSWLNKARARGEGPDHFRYGRRVVYRFRDVEAYAAAHRASVAPSTSSSSDEQDGGRA